MNTFYITTNLGGKKVCTSKVKPLASYPNHDFPTVTWQITGKAAKLLFIQDRIRSGAWTK
jgi:hypothetical protein